MVSLKKRSLKADSSHLPRHPSFCDRLLFLQKPFHAQELVQCTSVIHDIGKISLPVENLTKPSQLNSLEMSLIQAHFQAGYCILYDLYAVEACMTLMEEKQFEFACPVFA